MAEAFLKKLSFKAESLLKLKVSSKVSTKVFINTALVLLLMSIATLYTGIVLAELSKSIELLFQESLNLRAVQEMLDETDNALSIYLSTKSSDSLLDYISRSSSLMISVRNLTGKLKSQEAILSQVMLTKLIERFIELSESAVEAKRGRDVEAYSSYQIKVKQLKSLANMLLLRIESLVLNNTLKGFSSFQSIIPKVILSNVAMVIAASFLSLSLLARYSFKLTEPLSRLAQAARNVQNGNYNYEIPVPDTKDEIAATTAAFAAMSRSVQESIEKLKAQAELERSLMEERVRLLDLEGKLKEAELLALQTQINPHFLFNTLTAGHQLALVEGSERTVEFFENLAAFIRYTLKPPSRLVKIADELECAKRYTRLLNVRFGDHYKFQFDVDESVLEFETPALILQPLIENAVGHGFKNKENGGTIIIKANKNEHYISIEVIDNGEGIKEEKIAHVFSNDISEKNKKNGIGLKNVIRRVSLVSNSKGYVEIHNEKKGGTRVSIYLPKGDKN